MKFMKIRFLSPSVETFCLSLLPKPSCFAFVSAILCVSAYSLTAQQAQTVARGLTVLPGHVPSVIQRLPAIGRLAPSTSVTLAIGLPLRNREALNTFLQQIADPASPRYRHYLTPEQFTAMFGPSEQDYQAVVKFANDHGLTVTATHPNRLLVDVSAPAAAIESAFHIILRTYHHPTQARDFFAPNTEPSLDLATPVLHISGLDTYSLPHPASLHTKPIDVNAPVSSKAGSGSGPGGTFIGTDFRKAYVPGTTLTGAGQTVGLLEFDGYYAGDIARYVQKAGLNPVPLQNVLLDGADGSAGSANVEVALDIEVVIAMAPQVSKIIVYEAPNPSPFVDLLSRMAFDSNVKNLSCSWGGGGPDPSADQIFQQMAAQGQTFFNASGDSDAFTGSIPFPSDTPYITEVGGTTLTTDSSSAYSSETVWNWGGGEGSSGGISTYYPIPTWQAGVDMSLNSGSTTLRNTPDVALTADNVFIFADNGAGQSVGGTSAAAPLWAGFTALVNQQATAGCGGSVGFLNPAIYGIGKSTSYTNQMHDVTTGDNFSPGSPLSFAAKIGYDLCTGWGSPTVNLIAALAPSPSGAITPVFAPLPGSALLSGDAQPIFVTLQGFTNATVTASIPGSPDLLFANDGQPPDLTSNDFVYSATLQVPASLGSLPMTFIAAVPGQASVTNTFSYVVISSPANDNFVNATKVPAAGAIYLANNRYATIEAGEPSHAGDTEMAGSLWWAWTAASTTSVLIDTIGSKVDNVLAVYTGAALTSLKQVAAASSDVGQLKPGNVTFNAQAGQTYRIALASATTNSLGSLRLSVLPAGHPDTAIPVVTITGPQSGLTVSNQFVTITGTASDAAPNISGLNKVVVTVNGCSGGSAHGTTNWTATVPLQPELNIIQATAYDEAGNASAPVTIELVYFVVNAPNDLFANATPLTVTSGTTTVDTSNATKETGEPQHDGNEGGKSVWWLFTSPADGVLSLSTEGSSFDTVMAMYTGSIVSELSPVAGNDDAFPGAPGGYSFLEQAVHSNVTYAIAVDGFNGASGTNIFSWSFAPTRFVHLTATAVGVGSVQVATINSLGGRSIQPATSLDVPIGSTILLTATPAVHYRFDSWSGDIFSILNPVTFPIPADMTVVAHFLPVIFTDDFELGSLQRLSWTSSGAAPWLIESTNVAAGRYAARSGAIANNQTSSLILSTNFVQGNGSFDYRVSSELNFDFLKFFVDGNLVQQWSGEAGWTTFTFPLTSGQHTLEWRYTKDPGGRDGLDAAFIDDVSLPIPLAKGPDAPAKLQWTQGTDGSLFINVFGQTNQLYIIETSTDLIHWQNVSTTAAENGFFRITPDTLSNPVQFYRAIVP
jgi:hypothetical protein